MLNEDIMSHHETLNHFFTYVSRYKSTNVSPKYVTMFTTYIVLVYDI